MRDNLPVRLLLAAALSLLLALLLLAVLYATDVALSVWDRLAATPPWFVIGYVAVLALGGLAGAFLVWRVALPRGRRREREEAPAPPTEEAVRARLESAEAAGVDVAAVREELQELQQRRDSGEVHVSLFGQVSTGKSSLVRALLPEASPEVDPRGGTTRSLQRYVWTSPAGDRLTLVDAPGVNEPDGSLSDLAREEALRAHLVVYLVDGDITRDQYQELHNLARLDKPLILALNKADLYSPEQLAQLEQRLRERMGEAGTVTVVPVSAGAAREMVLVHPDGREELVVRETPPRVEALAAALQRHIDRDAEALDALRDAAVFVLAGRKLEDRLRGHRRERSEAVVNGYTRKAVVGALAAVTPGTDVLIQGYLGVRMVKELSAVYEVPATRVDVEEVLRQASARIKKAVPLSLAITGNALKAFPGAGTLAGGLAHAVAYGLLFDSLGRAIARTLESRGELPPQVVTATLEDTLSENLEARARRLAKIALGQAQQAGRSDTGS